MPPFIIFLVGVISSGMLALASEVGVVGVTSAAWLAGLITGLLIAHVLNRSVN